MAVLLSTLFIALFFISSCATKIHYNSHYTGREREVKADTKYGFLASEPTLARPYLAFKLVKIDTYVNEIEKQYDAIKTSEPTGMTKLMFFPVWLATEIVSLGSVDFYEPYESVASSEKEWVNTGEETEEKRYAISDVAITLSYQLRGEKKDFNIVTDYDGKIRKDLRRIALSVARGTENIQYVNFIVRAPPPYNCSNDIRISQDIFLEIYRKWSGEGYY